MLYFNWAEIGMIGLLSEQMVAICQKLLKLTGWRSLDKLFDFPKVDLCLFAWDQIDFVLQDNDMLQTHQINGSQVLFSLGLANSVIFRQTLAKKYLWTRFIRCY